MPLRCLNFVPLKMRYSCQGDVLLFYKREGDTIKKKILIIKATCDPGLLSGTQRH